MSEASILYVATNLTDLHAEPSFVSELLTQITNGAKLEVLERREKWVRARQEDGYEGWAYSPYLTDAASAPFTHIVCAIGAAVQTEPAAGEIPLTRMMGGTFVRVLETRKQFCRVEPVGGMLPGGWIFERCLREIASLPLAEDATRAQMIADARKLKGVYYLWGGCTALGIDCSGLSQLVHRLSGYTIPRDARLQYPVGREVAEPFQAGDLLFFWNDERTRIGHVGISTGGWNMIHASRARNGVYEEDVRQNENLVKSFAGARGFL